MAIALAVSFALLISILHYLSDFISLKLIRYRGKILPFAAGLSITYIFLELLPLVYIDIENLRNIAYIFILSGFTIFHVMEKYVYQHSRSQERLTKLMHVHSLGFFVYYTMIGIVLFVLAQNPRGGILFMIPILFHSTISSASFKEIHADLKESRVIRLFLASSTLIGVFIAGVFPVSLQVYYAMLGFVVGVLFYIIIKDIVPEKEEGDPMYFLAGIVIFSIFLALL